MKKVLWLVPLVLFLAITVPAGAQTDFDFSFTGSGYTASGVLVTTPEGGGKYLVTGITDGSINGDPISLLTPGTYAMNDNLVSPTFTSFFDVFVDLGGLGFKDATTGLEYNIYGDNPSDSPVDGDLLIDTNICTNGHCPAGIGDPVTLTLTGTPEPASDLLFVTGLLGIAFVMRKRRSILSS